MLKINMEKAVEIKKNRIREERNELLKRLDVEFMKALEAGDTVKQEEIKVKKQALRDVTTDPSIINATTPEELKAARPEILDQV